MRNRLNAFHLAGLAALALPAAAQAQERTISIREKAVIPENLTSGSDGIIYVGSYAKGGLYRVPKGSDEAVSWIAPGKEGLTKVMGLWVDEPRKLLWACVPGSRKTDTRQAIPGVIRTLALSTGKLQKTYELERGGSCNDLTFAKSGAIYVTDMDGRILRLARGDAMFRTWARDPLLKSADGLALLDDGNLYVNTYATGTIVRIAIAKDGSAGAIKKLDTDRPLVNTDGMRRVGPNLLLVAEGEGRVTELSVAGDAVTTHTVKDGIPDNPTGVTVTGGMLYISQANWASARDPSADKGVFTLMAIPYAAPKSGKK